MNKILFICFLAFSLLANAQTSFTGSWLNEPAKMYKSITMDTSKVEVVYHYQVIDRELQTMEEYDWILQLGDSVCKYSDYGTYRVDSVVAYRQNLTNGDLNKLHNLYHVDSSDYLTENFNSGILDFHGRVSLDRFAYKEPIPQFDWQLSDSTKEVCGYACHFATATFRGRSWTVWYCDIPQGVGPWKLNGTPGLILEASSDNNDHHFIATAIRNSKSPITDKMRNDFKTTRERFNASLLDYKSNPGKYYKNLVTEVKDANGNTVKMPRRKMFYNPLEKE